MESYFNEEFHIKKMRQFEALTEIEGLFSLDMLKSFNCLGKFQMEKILEVQDWPCKEEFEDLWDDLKIKGLFHFLCGLDGGNVERLRLWYIKNKM